MIESSCTNNFSSSLKTNKVEYTAFHQVPIESQYMGLWPFQKAEKLQHEVAHQVLETSAPVILGFEHPTVLTAGYRYKDQQINDLNQTYKDFEIVKATRGGQLTIHNPGQLVIYPLIQLNQYNLGIKEYVCLLLKTTHETFKYYGVQTFIDEKQVGLYTILGKIAFCGIQVKNGVTTHGLSINISNDTSVFRQIEACGVRQLNTDRLYNYKYDITLKEFFNQWVLLFKNSLNNLN